MRRDIVFYVIIVMISVYVIAELIMTAVRAG